MRSSGDEVHGVGDYGVKEPDVEDLSDSLVDIFRKQYANDVYKDWVVPLNIGGDVGN